MNQPDCKFIQVPTNLFYLMDANCTKVFITLIQMNSYYPKTDEGYFECAYKTLEMACGMSRSVIKASLAGLYNEGLVDVISVGKGRGKHTNRYKVNVETFKEYENTNLGIAIMTEDKPIHQVKYKGERFQVPWDKKPIEKQSEKGSEKKVTTNKDNIENEKNRNNIDNKYNINTEDNMLVNPIEERYTVYDDSERNIVLEIEDKPCSIDELKTIYLNSFGEFMSNYPGLNYPLVMNNQSDSFYECYQDVINELVMSIHQQSRRNITKEDVLKTLNNYLQYVQYAYQ